MSALESFLHHPIETLEKALHIRKQIDHLTLTLKEFFGHAPTSSAVVPKTAAKRRGRPAKVQAVATEGNAVDDGVTVVKSKKRTRSAATKAKMAAAQQKRWAKTKGSESVLAAPAEAAPITKAKKKGGMSAAGRARIVAAQKARWAKVKAGKSTTAPRGTDSASKEKRK